MRLDSAQSDRRARGEIFALDQADALLDTVGLSESVALSTADVSPEDRKKLKGIIARLRTKDHPFTTCMNDLAKNQPAWSMDRRKKTCAVLKQLAGKGGTKKADTTTTTSLSIDYSPCILLTEGMVKLLELADLSKLEDS